LERPLRTALEKQGYPLTITAGLEKTVKSCWLRFEEPLFGSGLSPHENAILKIKLEIDSHPPAGFKTARTAIYRYFPFAVQHHDLSSFLSGTLHAVFQRDFQKGRDDYDLFCYLSRWPEIQPNIPYLNNALRQTTPSFMAVTEDNWRAVLLEHLEQVDFALIRDDLAPFSAHPPELALVELPTFQSLLFAAES